MTRRADRIKAAVDQAAGSRRKKNPEEGAYGAACPECGSLPGEFCQSEYGLTMRAVHDSRTRVDDEGPSYVHGGPDLRRLVGYGGFMRAYRSHELRDLSTMVDDSGGLWTKTDSGITWHKAGGGWRRARHRPNPRHQAFITDFGESPVLTADDGTELRLGRYGVWKWNGRKHEVVDQGDDLEDLRARHGITSDVIRLKGL